MKSWVIVPVAGLCAVSLATPGCGRSGVCPWCGDAPALCDGNDCADRCAGAGDSSAGCRFVVARHATVTEELADGLVVSNPDPDRVATVQLALAVGGELQPVGEAVRLDPDASTVFELTASTALADGSAISGAGVYELRSDSPVVAYQHAPWRTSNGNDATMLLPDRALGRTYVAVSYPGRSSLAPYGTPSYFDVTALDDATTVTWRPHDVPTDGSADVARVEPDASGSVTLDRFETVRIVAADTGPADERDVSGTWIDASAPVVVVSGCRCAQVPRREPYPPFAGCDPVQEQLLPVSRWGRTYVAMHSPVRGHERHHWRVFAGEDGVTVDAEPSQPGFPHTFARAGDWIEVEVTTATSFVLEGDGAFLPVQYLQSAYLPEFDLSAGTAMGDSSMSQAIPVHAFADDYAFVVPDGYERNFVQIVHRRDAAPVTLDGRTVGELVPLARGFEVAEIEIEPGPHRLHSDDGFGVVQAGFTDNRVNTGCSDHGRPGTCFSSYAYAGGIRESSG